MCIQSSLNSKEDSWVYLSLGKLGMENLDLCIKGFGTDFFLFVLKNIKYETIYKTPLTCNILGVYILHKARETWLMPSLLLL